VGALLGLPIGLYLYKVVTQTQLTAPSPGRLVVVLVEAVLAVAVCTAIPAAFGARRPVADVLSAESA
jgi:putative ABC transport system permease protein